MQTDHQEVIHDMAYDYYGKRLATCSSDRTIKIWDQEEPSETVRSGQWKSQPTCLALKAHNGSIWRVCWAHPEFGQVVASCSFDKTVKIWIELARKENKEQRLFAVMTLSDFKDAVHCVQFAPRHQGLRLATACKDGRIRIYQAQDVFNLAQQWTEQDMIQTSRPSQRTTLSWNQSRFEPPTLLVGSTACKIWELDDQSRKWVEALVLRDETSIIDVAWAPQLGRSFHLVAWACGESAQGAIARVFKNPADGKWLLIGQPFELGGRDHKVWRVAWNVTGTMLATSSEDGSVKLWRPDFNMDSWSCQVELRTGDEH